jgi:hypothetical protein
MRRDEQLTLISANAFDLKKDQTIFPQTYITHKETTYLQIIVKQKQA